MNSFVIIANGPFLAPEIIAEAIQDKQIIALDGAADQLLAMDITPQVILGDFDSIHPRTQAHWGITQNYFTMSDHATPYTGRHGVKIVPAKDQTLTDLVKAIRYCDQHQAKEIHVICATGGREDQHEASKLALRNEYQHKRPITLHGEQQTLRWAENETIVFHGDIGSYCGFIAQEGSYGDTTGLLYPCAHEPHSLCNRLNASTASITIHGRALLIMPPLLDSQRTGIKHG